MYKLDTPRQLMVLDCIRVRSELTHTPPFRGAIGLLRRLWWWLTRKPKKHAVTARILMNGETIQTLENLWRYSVSTYPLDPPLVFDIDDIMHIEIFPPDAYYGPIIEINIKETVEVKK